jgi:hypothetical protein
MLLGWFNFHFTIQKQFILIKLSINFITQYNLNNFVLKI